MVRWRAGTDTANAPRILAAFFLLAAVSTPPIPPLGWKFVRSGTGKRDAVRDCHRIARVFVDKNELIFRIGLDELGVILVASPRITQIAEMTPGGLLNDDRSLPQVRRIRKGAYGQVGWHGWCRSNRIEGIILNEPRVSGPASVGRPLERAPESDKNIANFMKSRG